MTKIPNVELTAGFCYTRTKEAMTLRYICDCCGNSYEATRAIPQEAMKTEQKNDQDLPSIYQQFFLELYKEMSANFYHCNYCDKIICQTCWDRKDEMCPKCPLCHTDLK